MVLRGDFHFQRAGHIAGYVGFSFARDAVYQRQLRHQPPHRDGRFHVEGIVGHYGDTSLQKGPCYLGTVLVSAHQNGYIGPFRSPVLYFPKGLEDLSHLVVREHYVHRAGGLLIYVYVLLDIGV